LLQDKNNGESMTIMKNDRKIYEITKMYDQTGFPDEEMSLGYAINVYQESINQTFREYLVNFDYFTRIMDDYGFILVTKEEATKMNLPDGSGLFSDLFAQMQQEVKHNSKRNQDYGAALYMSPEEKRISYMNRYFVFKKVRSVDAKKMADVILKQNIATEQTVNEILGETEQKPAEVAEKKAIRKVAKKKVILKSSE
jgi:hypothetical protein